MKKKMSEMPMPEMPKPRTTVTVTRDQAGMVKVGQRISCTISGNVIGVRKSYCENKSYEIEIEDTKVSGIESNKADKALADLKGE